jgi:rhodanese-related sulfurtransferase
VKLLWIIKEKEMRKKLLITVMILTGLLGNTLCAAEDEVLVKITEDIPYLYVNHMGQKVKVARIQDTTNRLTDDYTKTSRSCPPFCIHPTQVNKNIKTIAEVEMAHFLKEKVNSGKGLVIDARLKSWYELETIPSAINIPYSVMESGDKKMVAKVFRLLGMKVSKDGSWDFSKAKELAIFCNGVWCDQSHRLIDGMLKYGYPAEKMYYYRSGFQGWKLLGLTTVVQKENVK